MIFTSKDAIDNAPLAMHGHVPCHSQCVTKMSEKLSENSLNLDNALPQQLEDWFNEVCQYFMSAASQAG